jgi:hypothetical protein
MQRGKSASVIEFPSIRFFSNVVEIWCSVSDKYSGKYGG